MASTQGAQQGQSNYDLCLQLYGSLDFFVKLLNDNQIKSSTTLLNSYFFDSGAKNINSKFIGYPYATNYINSDSIGVYGDYGGAYN